MNTALLSNFLEVAEIHNSRSYMYFTDELSTKTTSNQYHQCTINHITLGSYSEVKSPDMALSGIAEYSIVFYLNSIVTVK